MTDGPEEQFARLARSPAFLLIRQGMLHLAAWILLFSLFAATDSWARLTGWSLATLLNVLTGVAAGFLTVNLTHEWFHYLGARLAAASYSITEKPSLFVFNWHFEHNSLGQFYTMSIAGSTGGALGWLTLQQATAIETAGGVALLAGACASFAFGSLVEWPVLARTIRSRDPLAELSRLTPGVLGWTSAGSALTGAIYAYTLA